MDAMERGGQVMLILIADAFDASLPARLKEFGEVTEDMARLAEAEVILIRSKTKCTSELLDKAPRLKVIIRGGVGLDNVDKKAAETKGIWVTNTPEASSVAVAELAMAMMLAVPNRLIDAHTSMAEGKWLKKELKRTELYQKTLGLLGVGRIGTEVAKRARAFEMTVIAHDPFVKTSPHVELKPLDEVLRLSDYLSLHMPLTDETKGMIGEENIAKMKKGVIIVNTGRGKCIDEPALVRALESGQVGWYATDVWMSDPPPADSPLLTAKRILMAPHIGASSKENLLRIGEIVIQKLRDYKSGKKLS
jgi:D-3-phosphoglycerate dehydrogenase / 2-oxoglutarate reductase